MFVEPLINIALQLKYKKLNKVSKQAWNMFIKSVKVNRLILDTGYIFSEFQQKS